MKRVPLGLGLVAGLAGLGALALLAGCMLAAPGLAGPGVGGAGLTSPLIGSFDAAGEFGATQGGVQDMGLARELIASGRVPPPEAFVVEGMFSEHDLGLSGDACERTLCLRAALGIAPTLEDEPSGWVQIAMSSTIDVDAFERPGLTLIATVDVSGSMRWTYGTEQRNYRAPGEVARKLLAAVAGKLDANDRIAIVTYGSEVKTVLQLTAGDRQETIQAAIDGLGEGGSTNMEGGMLEAYRVARQAEAQTQEVRVMLFTDVQPNVGLTTASQFEQLAEEGAADGIGLTVMALGVGLGQEVLNGMSQIRGGNAFSLFEFEDVDELMADDWPWLVSPLAYDMSVELTPAEGFGVADSYGFPTGTDEQATGLEVSTVFLSKRKGALLARVTPDAGHDLTGLRVSGRLSYTTPAGDSVEDNIDVAYNGEPVDDRGHYFQQAGVAKTVALAVLVDGMKHAAEQYTDAPETAIATMRAVVERFAADAETLGDDALNVEMELANELLRLMASGAPRGDMYGQGVAW